MIHVCRKDNVHEKNVSREAIFYQEQVIMAISL